MDDYDGKEYYKEGIKKLLNEVTDTDTLDLVYKILLTGL